MNQYINPKIILYTIYILLLILSINLIFISTFSFYKPDILGINKNINIWIFGIGVVLLGILIIVFIIYMLFLYSVSTKK